MKGNKIKVAFVFEIMKEDFDGAARTVFQLINRIDNDQFEFLFLCAVPPGLNFKHKFVEFPNIVVPFNKDYRMSLPFLAERKFKKQVDKFKPDVIHVSTPSLLGKRAILYGNTRNIPIISIYHTHFIAYIEYYFRNVPLLIRPFRKLTSMSTADFYNRCSTVYVPTKTIIDELASFGVKQNIMKLWQRGINFEVFNPSKRDNNFLKSITGNDLPTILFASRLVWEKNLKMLIKINNQLKDNGIKFNMIIAGEGNAERELKEAIPDAFFTGNLKHAELAKLYASSDIFLFTSISETYGNVVAEAMASGLPCVIANGGGSADFVQNGINGFLCKHDDVELFVDRLKTLINNKETRARFSENGLKFVSGLSWNSLAETYFEDLKMLNYKLKITN
jgi:glycosyltransferase involved in cell wall biosynthesis